MKTTLTLGELQLPGAVQSADPFRLSEYSCAMIGALRKHVPYGSAKDVLDIGVGSGILLAAASMLGADRLFGIDVDEEAIARTGHLMSLLSPPRTANLVVGDMWSGFPGQKFDLIVANLPQFPASGEEALPGRRPFWSVAGPSGDKFIRRFLSGVAANLNADGFAILTQTCWVDMGAALDEAAEEIDATIIEKFVIQITPDKIASMSSQVLNSCENGLIHIGPFVFADVYIWCIRRKPGAS